MKRRDLIVYLAAQDCILPREGKRHSVYVNRKNQKTSSIPRHSEVNHFLAKKICNDLGVPFGGKGK